MSEKCITCQKEIGLQKLSCNHQMCLSCLSQVLLSTDFKSVNEDVIFQCACGKGSLTLSIEKVKELFVVTAKKPSALCGKHNLPPQCYCLDCKMYLCSKCKEAFHDEYCGFHRTADSEPVKENVCVTHPQYPIQKYCNKCNKELCALCAEDDKEHSDLHVSIQKAFSHLKSQILKKLKNSSYEDFEKLIKDKESTFHNEIQKVANTTKGKINEIIKGFQKMEESIDEKAKKEFLYNKSLFSIINYTYYTMYHYLDDTSTPISILENMLKREKELTDIHFIPADDKELDNINASLWKAEPKTLLKSVLDFTTGVEDSSEEGVQTIETGCGTFMIAMKKIKEDLIAVSDIDHTLRFFKKDGGKYSPSEKITGFSSGVRTLCYIEPKDLLLTGTFEGNFQVWKMKSQEELILVQAHTKCIRSIIQIDPETIATCSDDNTIKLFKIDSWECTATLTGHEGTVYGIYQLNDKRLISCSDDKTLKIWNMERLTLFKTMTEHEQGVLCVIQMDMQDNRIVSGGKDKSLKVWDFKGLSCKKSINAHNDWIYCLYDLGNGQLATGSRDNLIKIWDMKDYQCLKTFTGHSNTVISIFKEGKKLISGSADKTIKIWSM